MLGVSVDWQSGWVYWQGKQEKWNRLTIYNMKSAVTSEWSTMQLLPIARLPCPISPDLVAPPCPWPHSCPLASLLISIHTDCCRLTTHLPYSSVTLCQWHQSWYVHCRQRRGGGAGTSDHFVKKNNCFFLHFLIFNITLRFSNVFLLWNHLGENNQGHERRTPSEHQCPMFSEHSPFRPCVTVFYQ